MKDQDVVPSVAELLPHCYQWKDLEQDLREAILQRVNTIFKPDARMGIDDFRVNHLRGFGHPIRVNGENYLAAAEVRISLYSADEQDTRVVLEFLVSMGI